MILSGVGGQAVKLFFPWDEGAGDGRGDGAVRRGSRDDGTLAIQPESALHMIQALFLYPSIIISAINIVISCFYDLDKRYPSIIEDLKKRGEKA